MERKKILVKEELIKEGFDNYFSKPMDFREIERVFTQYVNEGRLQSDLT